MGEYTRSGTCDATRRIGDELVVYDRGTARTHAVNRVAAAVFEVVPVDEPVTVDEIRTRVSATGNGPIDADLVRLAATELTDAGLLIVHGTIDTIDRRGLLLRGGTAAAAAAAWPLIQTIVAPTAAAAQSGGGGGGGGGGAGGGALVVHRTDAGHEGDVSSVQLANPPGSGIPPAIVVQILDGSSNVSGYSTWSSTNNDIAAAVWFVSSFQVYTNGLHGTATVTFTYTDPNPPHGVRQTTLTVTSL